MAIQSSTSRYRQSNPTKYRHKNGTVVVAMPFRLVSRRSTYGGRAVVTSSGQEFDLLAHTEYGTTQLWWVVADENPHVSWPFGIPDDTEIVIPTPSVVLGRI